MTPKLYQLLIIMIPPLCLMGCSKPTNITTDLNINSAKYLNPDVNGQPAPVVVTLFELKAPFAFKAASFNQISNNAAALLGTNLIDKQSFEIRPASQQSLTQNFSTQTHFIGITAAYRNIEISDWRKVLPIPPGSTKIHININLASQSIMATTNH